VVHGGAEDMGTGFFAQGIVNNGDDVSVKQDEQEPKDDMACGIAVPSSPGQKAVQAGVVSLASPCGLDDAADTVTALTGNPSEGQRDKISITGLGETGSEGQQKRLHANGYGGCIDHGDLSCGQRMVRNFL
jgi:hypothetical protein